jgi:TolB-like protein
MEFVPVVAREAARDMPRPGTSKVLSASSLSVTRAVASVHSDRNGEHRVIEEPQENGGHVVWDRLRRRKVVQWGLAYSAGAWGLLQGLSYSIATFQWPQILQPLATLALLTGLPIVVVIAWYHGDKGRQRVTAAELTIITLLFALGGGMFWQYQRGAADRGDASSAPAGATAPTTGTAAKAARDDAPANSIAVLPFTNLSGDPSQDYFSDGMTEELLNVLAQIPGLEVAARTSVFQFKDKGGDVREIGHQLGVQYLIEGSVRRDGQDLRITAQMIRVADGFHVWSETWDRRLEGVFALQEDIARRIAEQLQGSISPDAMPKARGSVEPEAYDDYLKARDLFRNRRDMLDAIAHAERAVARAPDYAAAWASLSLIYEVSDWYMTPVERNAIPDKLARMAEAAERARALAPESALVLHALANVARDDARFLEAERLYDRAIAADPTYPDVREDYSEFLNMVGRPEDAVAAARAGIEVDRNLPAMWFRVMNAANSLARRDLWDEAATRLKEIAPAFYYTRSTFNDYDLLRGDYATARRKFEAGFKESPAEFAYALVMLKWAMRDPSVDDATIRASVASDAAAVWWPGFRGDADLFFAGLTLPFIPWKSSLYINFSPVPLQHYLSDPRAKKLLREWGFEDYWRARGWPALCRPLEGSDFECGPSK